MYTYVCFFVGKSKHRYDIFVIEKNTFFITL